MFRKTLIASVAVLAYLLIASPALATVQSKIEGRVSFQSDFEHVAGSIPSAGGTHPMPYLYVCAYRAIGQPDREPGRGDDHELGCARADSGGKYSISTGYVAPFGTIDVYLVTSYCDGDDSGSRSAANVCVRMNISSAGSPYDTPAMVKFTRSRAYDLWLSPGSINHINWNLSCPNAYGWSRGINTLTCSGSGSGALEPDETCVPAQHWLYDSGNRECLNADWLCQPSGDTNSNYGWNKEFIHTFRAAVQVVSRLGSQKPTASSVFDQLCTDDACQDEINVRVAGAKPPGRCSHWDVRGGNGAGGYDRVVVGLDAMLHPYAVPHEIGHLIHKRWMRRAGALDPDSCASGWGAEKGRGLPHLNERDNTAEGFADFVASASWFSRTHSNPRFSTYGSIENRYDPSLDDTCGRGLECNCTYGEVEGEGRVAQFFWDLYDNPIWDDEGLALSFADIRKVWSLFRDGTGDRKNNEDGADGVNVRDYYYHYNQVKGDEGWPSIWNGPMLLNCVNYQKYWYDSAEVCEP